MKPEHVKKILEKIQNVDITVYGDFCIDAYWILDPRGSEVSIETGLQADAVDHHYYSLGGASNVVANLASLKPAKIHVIGVIGDDIFGRELIRQFKELGVDTSGLVVQKENFDTYAFNKRYLNDNEQPRIDFGCFNKRTLETDKLLTVKLNDALQRSDVVILNQQIPESLNNPEFIDDVNSLLEKYDDKIVLLDSRHYGDRFKNIYRKTNEFEAALLNGVEHDFDDIIPLDESRLHAQKLFEQSRKPVILTRGEKGIVVYDKDGFHAIPGIQMFSKIDTVGAGDTTVSALALCLAAGCTSEEAAYVANFAAGVTVQILYRTGTATPEEVYQLAQDAVYLYQPELAQDIRQAKYYNGSEIEICVDDQPVEFGHIKHAIFDHDGTISTLREGWEVVMESMMIKMILGEAYDDADESLFFKVTERVRDYIDKSVGIQTILQMEALVGLVKEFGIVPQEQILDKFGYKKIYNDELMISVNQRIKKLECGELDIGDYTMKNVVSFLRALKDKGVKLYMASGTDIDDVKNEAQVLGYADLFDGGIYGAVSDIQKFSKKMLIEKIMTENNLHGSELVVFGDGPVEIRECRKRDGIAVGIASDELRRYGLNKEKRTRLIKAGAHLVISDYTQCEQLIKVLFPV